MDKWNSLKHHLNHIKPRYTTITILFFYLIGICWGFQLPTLIIIDAIYLVHRGAAILKPFLLMTISSFVFFFVKCKSTIFSGEVSAGVNASFGVEGVLLAYCIQ